MHHECARALEWEYANRRELLSPSIVGHIEKGWSISRARYEEAMRNGMRYRARIEEVFASHDFLLTPSAPGEAPHGLANTGNSVFNRTWTFLGVPCVTLPVFTGAGGLPIGVQIVGPYMGDTRTLRWAEWIRQVLG
jgi:Asp-tRNA(Asn)/Glu-tRNA(Gln) amidotransferase A subunit family amidase